MKSILKKLKRVAKNWVVTTVCLIVRGATVKFLPLRWIARIPLLVLFWLLKDSSYALISIATNKNNAEGEDIPRKSQLPLRLFFTQVLAGDKSTSLERYCSLLAQAQPSASIKYELMHHFMGAGRLDLAKASALNLMAEKPDQSVLENRLQTYRTVGTICFMLGENKEANHYWKLAGEFRKSLFKPSTPTKYRILGASWFVAVGHVAMLDYYLKYKRLYGQEDHHVVATLPADAPIQTTLGCASDLMRKFSELGIKVLAENELADDYNQWATENSAPKWHQLSSLERSALIDDFWEYEFPDGAILSYTHAAARIQKEWEQARLSPLLAVTQAEKTWLAAFLSRLGMPPDAWFVCVHVREAGFHKNWNSKLPAMRDSEVADYYPAMQEIVNAGGWVLRMGDPSMKPIPSMPNVIDYAHSPHRTPFADLLLAASCQFFLGTNSGYTTIPAIYGISCGLSNWVPIGWPLWSNQDLITCKLFREKSTQRLLSLEEIFKQGLAFLQNWSDLPADIELVANTPEDLRQLALEMLTCFGPKSAHRKVGAPFEVQNAYASIARRFETFSSSKLAASFVKTYPDVFNFREVKKTNDENLSQEQVTVATELAAVHGGV